MQIKVIRKEPGKRPEITEIENSLEALQTAVDGYIEIVDVLPGIAVICDEDGRWKRKQPNTRIGGISFAGTIVLAKTKESCDELLSLDHPERTMEALWTEYKLEREGSI